MKKIIILPSFASSHLLKCSIPNWIDVIEPDIIIINEGLFPEGPENKGHIDAEFRKKWCYKDTNAGFDFDETLDFVTKLTIERYNGNKKIPHIECRIINYKSQDVNKCFLEAISMPEIFSEGYIIFPLEPDVLFHEDDKEIIQEEISKLTPSQGLKCVWRDFLETQYYCDNFQNYKTAMDGFMTQNYPMLEYTNKFWLRHYPWFVSGKWKELRYELIYRKDPKYWQDFENGLQNICNESNYIGKHWTYVPKDKILIRPSRQDEARWAKLIAIDHPTHIQEHPNFVK